MIKYKHKIKNRFIVGAVIIVFLAMVYVVNAATTVGTNFATDGTFTVNGNVTLGNAASDVTALQGDITYTTSGNSNLVVNSTSSTLSQAAPFEVNNTSATALNSAQVISHTALSGSPSGDGSLQSGLTINATQADADASLVGIFVNDLFGSAGSGTEVAIFQSGTAWDYGLFTQDAVFHNLPADGTVTISGPAGGLTTVADGTVDIAVNSATNSNRGAQVRYGKTTNASGTQTGLRVYTEQGSSVTGTLYGLRVEDLAQSNGAGGQLSGATEHAISIGTNWDVGIAGSNVNTAGGSADFINFTGTTGVMNNNDTFNVFDINVTSANHTGTGNVITGIDLALTSADDEASERAIVVSGTWETGISLDLASADADVTEKAISITSAWDQAIVIDATAIASTLVGGAGIIDLRADFGTTAAAATQYGMYMDIEVKDDTNSNQYFTGFVMDFLNSSEDAGDETRAIQLTNVNNAAAGATATDVMLVIENLDATANSVGDGISFKGTANPAFITGINFDDANVGREIVLENGEAITNQSDDTVVIEDDAGTDYAMFGTADLQLDIGAQVGGTAQRLCHNGADAGTGLVSIGDCGATQADLAEYFDVLDTATAGDLVVLADAAYELELATGKTTYAAVRKNKKAYESAVLGVISTSPSGEVLGEVVKTKMKNPKPVALAGRVVVNVTNESGAIRIGDMLTASGTPGHAMKATKPGRVFGMALGNFDGKKGKVVVQIMNTWYAP